ncbi:MAG TPA: hypothetical protein VEQ42_12550, partial [Pyrinomonadaceae bacterium]|nr:hypothetical protein [Pyrinomonadaceae bacterium]
MRRVSLYVVCCSAALALVAAEALAQAPAAGAISGRVTQDGRPAAGVAVMLTPWDFTPRQSLLGRAT